MYDILYVDFKKNKFLGMFVISKLFSVLSHVMCFNY